MKTRRVVPGAVVLAVALAACGGDEAVTVVTVPSNAERCLDAEQADAPRVELLSDAVAVAEQYYGAPQDFYEISVDGRRVSLIVATADGSAEQSFYCGAAGFGAPEQLGPADGATFTGDQLDLDPGRVLSGIESELDDPTIIDFVVQAAPDGVLYDATVQSDAGGILLVLVSGQGEVLAVQTT